MSGKSGTLLPKRNGFACCPRCGRKLVKITAATAAEQLPIYCRSCSEYFTVNIQSGQCYFSPCPISPSGE